MLVFLYPEHLKHTIGGSVSHISKALMNRVIPIRVNNQLDLLFNVFISLLYMFRATQCSSSGESIVSIHHLVYITLCRWPSGMQVRGTL